MTINGNNRTLDGGGSSNLFDHNTGQLVINDLTMQNFSASSTAAVIASSSGTTLTINRSAFLNNENTTGGGAISSQATTTINRSYFVGNDANASGGGAIWQANGGSLTVRNSTFSGNIGGTLGMAIYSQRNTTLEYVTIADNTNDRNNNSDSAGIYVQNNRSITVRNSILSNNTTNNGTARDCYGAIDTYNDNIIEDPHSTCEAAAEYQEDPTLRTLSGGVYRLWGSSTAAERGRLSLWCRGGSAGATPRHQRQRLRYWRLGRAAARQYRRAQLDRRRRANQRHCDRALQPGISLPPTIATAPARMTAPGAANPRERRVPVSISPGSPPARIMCRCGRRMRPPPAVGRLPPARRSAPARRPNRLRRL